MVPESFEQNFHKTCSAVASENFQGKYINSVITLTLFQKEMNLIVQSMYEFTCWMRFCIAQRKLMAYNKTTQYEENISLKNNLQVLWYIVSYMQVSCHLQVLLDRLRRLLCFARMVWYLWKWKFSLHILVFIWMQNCVVGICRNRVKWFVCFHRLNTVAACLLHSKEAVVLFQVLTSLGPVLSKMSEINLLLCIRSDTYNKLLKSETTLFC
jgi:hypothetical protein